MDMTKVNALVQQLGTTVLGLAKLSVLVALVMVAVDVVAGTNLGVAARLSSLLSMTVKEMLAWGAGALVVYKLVLK